MKYLKNEYSRKDAAKITEVKASTLSYWMHHLLVTPDAHKSTGPGSPGKFTQENLIEILLLKELSRNGLSLDQTHLIILLFKGNIIEYTRAVEKQLEGGGKLSDNHLKKFISLKPVNRFSSGNFKRNELFLLIFDAHLKLVPKDTTKSGKKVYSHPMSVHVSEFRIRSGSINSGKKIMFMIDKENIHPKIPESFSSLIVIDIRGLYEKVEKNLSRI